MNKLNIFHPPARFWSCAAALGMLLHASAAPAQQVSAVSPATLRHVPPDLIQADPVSAPNAAGTAPPVDLGQEFAAPAAAGAAASVGEPAAAAGVAAQAAQSARRTRRPPPGAAAVRAGVERAVFERSPISVPLPVGTERLITLPAPAALHVPADMAQVARLEVIDRTIYATALVPFTTIRIVAELIDTGQQIPMDLVAGPGTSSARAELEVFSVDALPAAGNAAAPAASSASTAQPSTAGQPAVDMVELTRHAARQLYAPRRLAWATPGVQQMEVSTQAVPGLMRGIAVETVPLGQWRAANLYVTAVRVTNRSRFPLELPLEDIRGRWLSATAQHGRIGPAGTDTDTTAVYLVCDRAFDACMASAY